MSIELRLPKITATSEREQLLQLKSYLYQLTEQLQIALNITAASDGSAAQQVVIQATNTPTVAPPPVDAAVTFAALKPLIIKSADIVEAYYEEINKKLEGLYVAQSDFGTFAEKTELNIEANSKYIDQQYENIQVIITDEIDGVNNTFNKAFEDTDSRITEEVKGLTDAIDGQMDVVNEKIGEVDGQIDGINASVGKVEKVAGDLGASVSAVEEEIGKTNTKVDETSRDVSTLKTDVATTQGDVTKLNDAVDGANKAIDDLKVWELETRGHIKSGEIDRYVDDYGNEFPVLGIEIGQVDTANGYVMNRRYARFTADRLSFYDQNGFEVAYISNQKLFIRNVELYEEDSSYKIGGFVDTAMSNGDVVTKWEGRG
jgi:archaellum component FlaC